MTLTTPNEREDWEIEFDKKFMREDGLCAIGKYGDGEVKFFIDLLLTRTRQEERERSFSFTVDDMQKVGDHYWGNDYSPSLEELTNLTHSMNLMLESKLEQARNLT